MNADLNSQSEPGRAREGQSGTGKKRGRKVLPHSYGELLPLKGIRSKAFPKSPCFWVTTNVRKRLEAGLSSKVG